MSEIVQEQIKEIEKLLKEYLRIKNEAKNARRAETEGTEDDSSPEAKEKKRCRAQLKRACAQLLTDCGLAEAPVRYSGVLDETVRETFREYFVRFTPGKTGTIKASGIRSYMERVTEKGVLSDRMIRAILFNGNPADNYLLHLIAREDPDIDRSLRLLRRVHDKAGLNTKSLIKEHTAGYQAFMEDHAYQIGRSFTEKTIANLLAKNPLLKRGAEQYQRALLSVRAFYPVLFHLCQSCLALARMRSQTPAKVSPVFIPAFGTRECEVKPGEVLSSST